MKYRFKQETETYTRAEIMCVLAEKYWKARKVEVMPDRLRTILNQMILDGVVILEGIGEQAKA